MGAVYDEEAMHGVRTVEILEISVPSSQPCYQPKSALEKLSLGKKRKP